MIIRLLSLLFLSFFVFTTVGEARNTPSIRSSHVQKPQLKAARHPKRIQTRVISRKKQSLILSVKRQQQIGKTKRQKIKTKKPQKIQTKPVRKKSQHVSVSKKKSTIQKPKQAQKLVAKKSQRQSTFTAKKKQDLKIGARTQKAIFSKKSPQPRIIKKQPTISNKSVDYFAQLNRYTQRNARIGKLDYLFSKSHLGSNQTIALIEYSGDWDEMREVISGKKGTLPLVIRESYQRNFLQPIGDPRVDPNAKLDKSSDKIPASSEHHHHGSRVASVLLDLSPQAKILPVSTYKAVSGQTYDMADALMALVKRPDVSVINISAGRYEYNVKSEFTQDYKLITTYSFPPKHIEAFKAIAKAGKIIVMAAGNDGKELQNIPASKDCLCEKFRLHLLEGLEDETKKSIIFAGNLEPDTYMLDETSTRPGTLKGAQDIFLCAPGEVVLSYNQDKFHYGTSLSAPYISAAIANLCSRSPKITPKQAVRALLETAEKRSDVRTYGRGIINAARALDWLEKEVLK